MDKITLEITSEGWESTVIINGKEFKEKHIATVCGSEEVEEDIPKEVCDAFNSFFPFDCMLALQNIES